MVDDVGHGGVRRVTRRQHGPGPRRRRCYVGDQPVAAGRELAAEAIARADGRGPQRPLHPAAELHPQHHRVPAPRAGPAAARPRRSRRPGPRSRAGRSSSWSGATTTARTSAGSSASSASSDPVLIGVDAGADALIAAGHRPDIVVVGEDGLAQGSTAADSGGTVSDKALRGAAGGRAARRPLRSRGRRGAGSTGSASGTRRSRRPAPARTSRCCSPTSRGRQPDRRGRHPRHPRRVPRPAARRAGQHLPDPAARRPEARRRQGRAPAVLRPGPAAGTCCSCCSPGSSPSRVAIAATPVGAELVVVDRRHSLRRTRLDPRTVLVISFRYHIVSIVVGLPGARRRRRARWRPAQGRGRQHPASTRSRSDRATRPASRPRSRPCAAATPSPTSSPRPWRPA